jgi:S-adenosylmethionine:tRNA ribosyltransferase-isomerase
MAGGVFAVKLTYDGDLMEILSAVGQTPLPPYIKRDPELIDRDRYQCVYAEVDGSVAAPTAGLHFSQETLADVQRKGIGIAKITLHVGLGTFLPVKSESIEEHDMHSEHYLVPPQAVESIETARSKGGRIIAVGTTSVRTLEAASDVDGKLKAVSGNTDLFIFPGYRFRAVDAIVTNFHLPRSTLLMLVSAFAGREFVMEAYERAIRERYRFYSYGDAMLIV